jgi:hypothetical protein
MKPDRERPDWSDLPPPVRAEIEASWGRYRGRGRTRRNHDRAVTKALVALARLVAPWAFPHA